MEAKLSVWSAYYIDLSPEDAVREFKKYGYTCSELSDEHGLALLERGDPKRVGAEFKAFLEQEGFEMPQGHLWLSCRICEEGAVPVLQKWLELYEAIGVKNAVLHCDTLRNDPDRNQELMNKRNLDKLLEIQAGMEGMNIRICLENLYPSFAGAEPFMWLIDRLDPDKFGVCLDTGHLNVSKAQSQGDFIRTVGGRLRALHIADNEGQTDQHMMPYGKGNVDFEDVVRALREVDYHGLFNLEIPGERFAPLPVRGYKLEYIKKCYDYLMQIP